MAPSAPLLRRFICCCSNGAPSSAIGPTTTASASGSVSRKKNLVFMGSPQVSASVLDALMNASEAPDSIFQLAAIVTQPPSARDRGRKLLPSPVAQHAIDRGFSQGLIFTPERAGEETFLSNLKAINPELCVTAAYGNILPTRFLEIPTNGTVNIHPSLLPLYRGAAPVQRALQDGVAETGVSLAYTVRKLDAGPIIAYEKVMVDDSIKAPQLLSLLFDIGSKLLIRELPALFGGSAWSKAQEQDESKATLAPKLTVDESWLSFNQEAKVLHNKVRAFAGWPGTRARIHVGNENGSSEMVEVKIVTTRMPSVSDEINDPHEITFIGDCLVFPCANDSHLQVLELQLPGKKVMRARDFWNGLRGQKLKLV